MFFCCLYYGLFHFRIGRWHRKAKPEEGSGDHNTNNLPPVSVVLTAHNDVTWLKENLVYLLEQDYPDFEVVVVDYLSQDDTPFVLKLLKDYYPHLKIVPFKEDVNLFQGKKYPLSIGIKSAKNDILLLADPDCTPKNMQWLRGMVKGYMKKDTQIVLGFCGLNRTKTLLGPLQQYDNLAYSSHYLGCALLGHPYTGSGRNLSYRRSFFFKRGAFINHYSVAGGSDDLFVYQNATRTNTAISISGDACLRTEPKKRFSEWHKLRLARVSTRNWHSVGGRMMEDLLPISNVVFYAMVVLLALGGGMPWGAVLIAAVLKWAWQIVAFAQLCKRFEGGLVYLAAPLFEIYFIIANTILVLTPLDNNRKFSK
ncbi:MAG: glycosyltransferase [Bacteroidales bacterium]|nr:glycosyltransferase [Bacteroidales bacterium]